MDEFSRFAETERTGWAQPEQVEAYAALFAPASDQLVPAVVAASGAGPGWRVLDLCCGHGNVTAALLETGAEVTGLDFSPAMLAAARKRAPGAELVEGDAQSMPFADAVFDAVTCSVGIGHVPDQPRALAEVARVLKPGGMAALTSWCEPERSPFFQVVFAALKAKGDRFEAIPPAPDFHLLARPDDAEGVLREAGLTDVEFTDLDTAFVFDRPERFAEVIRRSTVRARMAIAAQGAAAQTAIWQSMTDTVDARFGDGAGTWRVPFPAVLAVARKPR